MSAQTRLVKQVNRVFHEEESAEYDARHPEILLEDTKRWDSWLDAIAPVLKDDLHALDIGTGTGFVASLLAERLNRRSVLFCADLSPRMLDLTRRKLDGNGRKASVGYSVCDAECLPFESARFGLVTASAVLHHLPCPDVFLREVDRVLRPGGVLILAHEPNRRFFQNRVILWTYIGMELFKKYASPANYYRKLAKVIVPVRRGATARQAPGLYERVAERLRREGLVDRVLSPNEIQSLVDVNVSWAGGDLLANDPSKEFDPFDLKTRFFPRYHGVDVASYGHMGEFLPHFPPSRLVHAALRRLYPQDGLHFVMILRKPHL